MSLLILLLYPAINLCEAWLEVVVIKLKDPSLPNYKELNRDEHIRSFVFAVLVCSVFINICIMLNAYYIIPAVLVNRRLVFDFALKKMRGRELWKYEGDAIVDIQLAKIFRSNALYEFLTLVLITAISITLQFLL